MKVVDICKRDRRLDVERQDARELLFQLGGLLGSLRTVHDDLAAAVVELERDHRDTVDGLSRLLDQHKGRADAADRARSAALGELERLRQRRAKR